MYRNIFLKTLSDGRRSMLYVGIGLFALGLYVAVLYPDISEGFAGMIDDLPEFLQGIIGDAAEFATPEGFFTTQPFTVIGPITIMALAINRGMSAVAGEEEGNTLDQLLGNPVSRTSVVIHKSMALIVSCIPPVIFLGASLVLGGLILDYTFSSSGLIQMLISLLLLGYAMGFLSLGIGAATGSKSLAMAIPSAVAAVGYVVNLLAPQVESLTFTRYISVMHYYIGDKPFINGITPWHALVLIGIAVVPLIVGLYRFNERDLNG